jgi:tetratricopeptide (TPR) repeat protein
MLKSLSLAVLLLALPESALSQQAARGDDARRVADEATDAARAGKFENALRLYTSALALAPNDVSILRDYAVALGWAEKYSLAIPVIRRVLSMQGEQPEWALREFARSLLFGGETEEALQRINQLVGRGDYTEATLARRGLALRWLDRGDEAQMAYADIRERYPQSAAGYVGLAYTAADRGRLSDALQLLESAPGTVQTQPDFLVARIQILNWMGRHYEAQRFIADIPPQLSEHRDILKESVLAERWGGNPSGAMRELQRLESLYPDQSSRDLLSELRTEYGHVLIPSFRYSKDSDGLVDRSASFDAVFHINPSHAVRAGYQYRWMQMNAQQETLVRYDLGWSGALTRHVAVYSTISNVDYRTFGLPRKIVGDAGLRLTLNDKVRFDGGGGKIAMDAFQSLPNQVTASFGFGELGLTLGRNRAEARYARYAFSDGVIRHRVNGQFMRSLVEQSAIRLSAGFRAGVMSHSESTPDFYSPSRLHSYLAVGQFSGRLARSFDYYGEVAAGWQSEFGSPLMHPFQIGGGVGWHPSRHLRVSVDGGKSTASMDRLGSGLRTYSRWSASGGIEVRFP